MLAAGLLSWVNHQLPILSILILNLQLNFHNNLLKEAKEIELRIDMARKVCWKEMNMTLKIGIYPQHNLFLIWSRLNDGYNYDKETNIEAIG